MCHRWSWTVPGSPFVELQDLEKESMLVIGDPTKEFSIQNIKTVSVMITSSKKTELLMTQLMKSLSNFSG